MSLRQVVLLIIVMGLCVCREGNAQEKNGDGVEATIVSWNVQMLPNFFRGASKHLRKKQRVRLPWIVEFVEEKKYDLIVFQEIFDVEQKRRLMRELKDSYPYQVAPPKRANGQLFGSGILIVSRIPMKYVDKVIYKKGVGSDKMASKGCTLVEAEKDGQKFHVAGTHLQSGGSKEAQANRDKQYKDIRKLLDKHKKDNIPQFVLGDLNTRKSAKERYSRMIESLDMIDFPLDEPERPFTVDGQNSWSNKDKKGEQIDYVLLNPEGTETTITQQKVLRPTQQHKGKTIDLADHYGVEAKILLK